MNQPRDAIDMHNLLMDCGVDEYDPNIVNVLLEVYYRHVKSVLVDAQDLHLQQGKEEIDERDIDLSISLQHSTSNAFQSNVNYAGLHDFATILNAQPIPLVNIENPIGVPLHAHSLQSASFQVDTEKGR